MVQKEFISLFFIRKIFCRIQLTFSDKKATLVKDCETHIFIFQRRYIVQLNITTDYAIRTVIFLGQNNEIITSGDIASNMKIPHNYLAKILKKLKKAGLIRSIAGSQGGYMLVKRPEEITLGEIISTTETTMKINRCLEADTYCSRNATATCMIRKYYQILQNEIDNVVLKRTIGDILNERYTKP
mgnify:FL=1